MSQTAIKTLTSMVKDHYRHRDGEYNIENVYLIYGYEHEDGVQIDYFANCMNSHEDPLNFFGVAREDAELVTRSVRAERPEAALVGCLHTHEDQGNSGPSWDDVDAARENTINAVLCAYERSVSFYDEHGFIIKFHLHRGRLVTTGKEVVNSDTHIAQYPFPTPGE